MPLLAIVGLTIVVLAVVGIAYESHRYAREKTRPELPQDHPIRVLPWWQGQAQLAERERELYPLLYGRNGISDARYSSTHQPYDWAVDG